MRRLNHAARHQSQCERSRLDATQEPVGREVWLLFPAFQAGRRENVPAAVALVSTLRFPDQRRFVQFVSLLTGAK